ncbi:MAG: TspO protein [Candidatus Doudnabacteria bacterium RIFCSPHIGHO2_02_FULL_46_11]|uniref:TspO protein n=1 Tax=Candidatus Doudnabacteria bacterium RIFCSPHIGHO2_02_FULL_46_11 TaxID=1817832 RepID=A0A1F5P4J0_9BACT|nr:MAG: TspO protein [Candidatus Doudnabacteria bacterium RIFCSPHIGHO2_02_FULL_46_11]
MHLHNWLKLAVAVVICEFAGVLGSVFIVSAIPEWYAGLAKPDLAPPNWIFGPVWATLYFLMGLAAFLVWRRGLEHREVRLALQVFGLQLMLNALWSIIFFGMQMPGLALAEIVIMWLAIVWTIVVFYRLSRPAAYLLWPYLAWVSFAAYLNYAIWFMNK